MRNDSALIPRERAETLWSLLYCTPDSTLRLSDHRGGANTIFATPCPVADISGAQQTRRFQRGAIWRRCHHRIDGAALLSLVLVAFVLPACLTIGRQAHATWKPEYANAAPEVQEWYRNAQLTDAAQRRFGFKSCCPHSDVVKTAFRVDKANNGDELYWLKNSQWTLIPSDIIHWGESAPDSQPTLFAIGNVPTCFFPGEGGL